MLRPNDFIEYVKHRRAHNWTDYGTLAQGLTMQSLLVVGGGPPQAMMAKQALGQMHSLAPVISLQEMSQVDTRQVLVLDHTAAAQLLMLAKNESFHDTATLCIQFIQDHVVEGDLSIEDGLTALRAEVDKIARM